LEPIQTAQTKTSHGLSRMLYLETNESFYGDMLRVTFVDDNSGKSCHSPSLFLLAGFVVGYSALIPE
tara:strand:- start:225 stop:425 length:201 start_codon:yes stop_codon:yes gene_type:complete